jgi:hypothetical protein
MCICFLKEIFSFSFFTDASDSVAVFLKVISLKANALN